MKLVIFILAVAVAASVDAGIIGAPLVAGHLGSGLVAATPGGLIAAGVISPGGILRAESAGPALTLTHNAALVGPSAASVDYTPIHIPVAIGLGLHHVW